MVNLYKMVNTLWQMKEFKFFETNTDTSLKIEIFSGL